jgi:aryl-alcohol dehydrogenase-like predicted oxidoreductase
MERRRLGRTGMDVSVLGFGASEIGTQATLRAVERLLNSALDSGLNIIDSAECYGESEELIGRAVASRRSDYYLLTKCGHAAGLDLPDWSPALIKESIKRSLKRLKTDYLDIIQLHTCTEQELRDGDLIEVLVRARDSGIVRHLGYSGDGVAALYAVQSGYFDTLQISVSVADQEALDLVLPEAIDHDVGVIAKRPIANAAWLTWGFLHAYARPYQERLRQLRYDFLRRGAQESVGIALRFTLSTPGVHTAIVGTAKASRWEQNAAQIAKGPLPRSEYEKIRSRWREIAKLEWTGRN